jgi:hypothetical protein
MASSSCKNTGVVRPSVRLGQVYSVQRNFVVHHVHRQRADEAGQEIETGTGHNLLFPRSKPRPGRSPYTSRALSGLSDAIRVVLSAVATASTPLGRSLSRKACSHRRLPPLPSAFVPPHLVEEGDGSRQGWSKSFSRSLLLFRFVCERGLTASHYCTTDSPDVPRLPRLPLLNPLLPPRPTNITFISLIFIILILI